MYVYYGRVDTRVCHVEAIKVRVFGGLTVWIWFQFHNYLFNGRTFCGTSSRMVASVQSNFIAYFLGWLPGGIKMFKAVKS